jgi:hypothetical protein
MMPTRLPLSQIPPKLRLKYWLLWKCLDTMRFVMRVLKWILDFAKKVTGIDALAERLNRGGPHHDN